MLTTETWKRTHMPFDARVTIFSAAFFAGTLAPQAGMMLEESG